MVRVAAGLLSLVAWALFAGSASAQRPKEQEKQADKVVATLRVLLPDEAQLQIDDSATKSTGPERRFTTPPLAKGKAYFYTFKWTYSDGGQAITRMAVIQFKGGEEKLIDLRPGSDSVSSQIIYVPTAQNIVDKMLELAKVNKNDVIYDLGCGDGRILVTAAKKYGARGVGIDIDPERIKDSKANIKKNMVDILVEVRQGDALKVADIGHATVVTLYMLPEFQEKLAPILKKELKPGTRVVAHDYWLPGWTDEQQVSVPGPFRKHTLYLYRVGDK
jgi:uncharacterized protein (TIGR03000 family)